MRIGLFSDTYLPDVNGVVTSVELLRKKLCELGHEVFVICTYKGLLKVEKEGNIIRLPGIEAKKLYGYALTSPLHPLMMDEIKDLELDIIHLHTEFGVGIFGQMCAESLHIPLVRTYHTTYEDYTHYINFLHSDSFDKLAKKIVINWTKYLGRHCLRMIVPSKKTYDLLVSSYGLKVPIDIIPTGIELDRFDPKDKDDAECQKVKDSCKVGPKEKLLLYVGRVAQEKSIDLLIRTMSLAKDLKVKLLIVGGGPDLENLKDLVNQSGLQDKVYFAGKVPFVEVPQYYHACDAFISASTSETQGMTYVEAMSSARIIFARRDECVKELLYEGENGFYFDNEQELYAKIKSFLALDEKKTNAMEEKSLSIAREFDAGVFAERVYSVYTKAMNAFHDYYLLKDVRLYNDYVKLKLENGFKEKEDLIVSLDSFLNEGLRKGMQLQSSTYDRLKMKETSILAYVDCLKALARKDYTIKQMYDHIQKKYDKIEIEDVNAVIERLLKQGLLNDEAYARSKIESFETKLFSYKHIFNSLRKDGVPIEIITKVLAQDEDRELKKAYKLALKYQNNYRQRSLKMQIVMLKRKLYEEGFTNEVIEMAIKDLDFSEASFNEIENLRREAKKAKERYSKKLEGTQLRNRVYHYLASKGYSSDNIYTILNEMRWKDE